MNYKLSSQGTSQQILQILTRGISSKPKSTFNIEINFMLKFKGWAQGCVFFLLLFTETERVLLCRKVFEVQLYEFWLKSGLIEYQQGHLEGIFLANFCKIFFRFEGSLLANCERQSVEEDHYGNLY